MRLATYSRHTQFIYSQRIGSGYSGGLHHRCLCRLVGSGVYSEHISYDFVYWNDLHARDSRLAHFTQSRR